MLSGKTNEGIVMDEMGELVIRMGREIVSANEMNERTKTSSIMP